jgi:hypothetical protein
VALLLLSILVLSSEPRSMNTLFVLIRDGVAHFVKLNNAEKLFFDYCKQAQITLEPDPEGAGWRVNRSMMDNPDTYRVTFPTFYRYFASAPGLLERSVTYVGPCERVEVVHVKYEP